MKLMLNGALTIGTFDGANVEILEAAGADNFFLFGMTKEEVLGARPDYSPERFYKSDAHIKRAVDFLSEGFGGNSYPELAGNLIHSDPYMVLADFESYRATQQRVEEAYRDPEGWSRMSLMNVANSGIFSADRAVREYAGNIWGLAPVK
jgi:starch phosphorylase